jgi:hypothetical protein
VATEEQVRTQVPSQRSSLLAAPSPEGVVAGLPEMNVVVMIPVSIIAALVLYTVHQNGMCDSDKWQMVESIAFGVVMFSSVLQLFGVMRIFGSRYDFVVLLVGVVYLMTLSHCMRRVHPNN